MTQPDLRDRDDLAVLLRDFYERAFADPLLGEVFLDVMHVDLEHHLPVVVAFWDRVLFDRGGYSGRTMEVHRRVNARIPLTPAHFDRWVELWQASLADRFSGPVAARAATAGQRMAAGFLRNLGAPTQAQGRRVLPITGGAPATAGQPVGDVA